MFLTSDPHQGQTFSEAQIRRMIRDEIETDQMHQAQAAEHDAALEAGRADGDGDSPNRGALADDDTPNRADPRRLQLVPLAGTEPFTLVVHRAHLDDEAAGELLARVAAALRQSHAGIAGALDSMAEAVHTGATRVR